MDAAPLSTVSKHRGDDEQAIMVPYVAASMGAVEMSMIQAEDNGWRTARPKQYEAQCPEAI
jgi:hypothetical protein